MWPKHRAIKQIWAQVEKIDDQLRTFGADTRKFRLDGELDAFNGVLLRNSVYLLDGQRRLLNDYACQLREVDRSIVEYQRYQQEWYETMPDDPHASRRAVLYHAANKELDALAEKRAAVKATLLGHNVA